MLLLKDAPIFFLLIVLVRIFREFKAVQMHILWVQMEHFIKFCIVWVFGMGFYLKEDDLLASWVHMSSLFWGHSAP